MTHSSSWWVGLDDDARRINVAVFKDGEQAPRHEFVVSFDSRGLKKLAKKLLDLEGTVRCAYEAGPCGYVLYRYLKQKGIGCTVAAPSLTPRKPGRRVKTNRLDARKIGTMHRSGMLTAIRVPTEEKEGARDLVRAREDTLQDVDRCRKRLNSFLLRQGRPYYQGNRWTEKHWRWLRSQKFDQPDLEMVFEHYMLAVQISQHHLRILEEEVRRVAERSEYAAAIRPVMALYGVRQLTALTIVVETIDFKRYYSAPAFMASTGIVPSENSSGEKQRRFGITKTGNAHLRRVLIEAAWHYSRMRGVGKAVLKRREGLPTAVLQIAQKADVRLRRKYLRMTHRKKRPVVAVTAVARELAGFMWAIGQAT